MAIICASDTNVTGILTKSITIPSITTTPVVFNKTIGLASTTTSPDKIALYTKAVYGPCIVYTISGLPSVTKSMFEPSIQSAGGGVSNRPSTGQMYPRFIR